MPRRSARLPVRKNPPRRRLVTGRRLALATAALFGLAAFAVFALRSDEPAAVGQKSVEESARDAQLVAGIEAREPWADMGTVPLDTPVGHEWLLRNTGPRSVSLGKATIETLEGC